MSVPSDPPARETCLAAISILPPRYQLFQAANNTAVMADIPADQRGVISGVLNLSRNLGLLTGASAMGAVAELVMTPWPV